MHDIIGRARGHDTIYVGGKWHWLDTNEIVDNTKRECIKCGLLPTEEGYDPCIGKVEGAVGACCGHGKDVGYILWPGTSLNTINSGWIDSIRIVESPNK